MGARTGLLVGVLALVIVGLAAGSAEAQFGFGGGGGYGLGFYNYNGGYGINSPQIPYYALYPPVYYSYPVPRTYGYSPFAYPPGTPTPDVAPPPAAARYRNPFVTPTPATKETADQVTAAPIGSGPRRYYNPFVKQAVAASK